MMGIASIWDWQTISNERAYGSGLPRYLSKQLLFLLLVAFLLLYCSRDPEWTMAWRYMASLSLIMAVNLLAMNRSLLSERSKLQEGTKKWEVGLSLLVAVIGPFLVVVVASLDHRCHWGETVPALASNVFLLLFLLGSFFATWAMHANQFYSATARIQADCAQKVVDSGPYQLVRHPGYLVGTLGILATALALQSYVALIPVFLVVIGYAVRTALEDRVLRNELESYQIYSLRVKYRLVMFVW